MTDVYPYDGSVGMGNRWLGGMTSGDIKLQEPIRLELVFRSIEGMSLESCLEAMEAFQTIVVVAWQEAVTDAPGVLIQRPWLELTRIQYGSKFKFEAILRNPAVQKRA